MIFLTLKARMMFLSVMATNRTTFQTSCRYSHQNRVIKKNSYLTVPSAISAVLTTQMHIFHHQEQGSDEGKGQREHCAICGRQLLERKGLLHRLTPISNAFVLNGYCLCHSDVTDAQMKTSPRKTPTACQHDGATPQTAPQE